MESPNNPERFNLLFVPVVVGIKNLIHVAFKNSAKNTQWVRGFFVSAPQPSKRLSMLAPFGRVARSICVGEQAIQRGMSLPLRSKLGGEGQDSGGNLLAHSAMANTK